MRAFLTALKFLTVLPWPRKFSTTQGGIGRSAPLFPVVGLCLGLVLVLVNRLLDQYLSPGIHSTLLVTLLILMTRALHMDGLGDTFDGLGAKGDRETALKAMQDSCTGIFGLVAVVVVIVFKIRAIEVLGDGRDQALLLAPVMGRWAMVVLAFGSESAREGMGRIMVEHVRGPHVLLATAFTLLLIIPLAGRTGLLIALSISLFTLISSRVLHRRLGGVTGDSFGAVGEISETTAFVILASV